MMGKTVIHMGKIGGEQMSTRSTQELLVIMRELKPKIMKRYKAKEIELFGSIVRGEQSETSDIDILVDFEEGADLFDLTGLAIFLEEELGRKVDVVPKRALREELRQAVLKEAVRV
jgi:predicted nucleotidyltransferase